MCKSIINKIKELFIVFLVIAHVPIMHIDSQWHVTLITIMEHLFQKIEGNAICGIHFQVSAIVHYSRIRVAK